MEFGPFCCFPSACNVSAHFKSAQGQIERNRRHGIEPRPYCHHTPVAGHAAGTWKAQCQSSTQLLTKGQTKNKTRPQEGAQVKPSNVAVATGKVSCCCVDVCTRSTMILPAAFVGRVVKVSTSWTRMAVLPLIWFASMWMHVPRRPHYILRLACSQRTVVHGRVWNILCLDFFGSSPPNSVSVQTNFDLLGSVSHLWKFFNRVSLIKL